MLRDGGQLGYEQGHYEVSQTCGERVLFPAVRGSGADDLVVAPGFSCRHQTADFCDNRRSLHTAECWRWRGEGASLRFESMRNDVGSSYGST
jgi:hypothetical protein